MTWTGIVLIPTVDTIAIWPSPSYACYGSFHLPAPVTSYLWPFGTYLDAAEARVTGDVL